MKLTLIDAESINTELAILIFFYFISPDLTFCKKQCRNNSFLCLLIITIISLIEILQKKRK